MPTQQIDSWCVSVETESLSVDALANQLRNGEPAVIGRIHNDRLVLDLRTIHPQYDILLVELLSKVVG